ncbi:FadR/GntR family transcriptional regulator [Inquilinus sp.]|jgi:DNA-binding FadR family transcriptional regulator|uniref:FadR/GntR family transcriptional regulator n=1 Tax=Inquilinus sp. TaxID=1932117 RepID=UPI0037839723
MPLQAVVNRKLYIQIAEQITAAIESGEFKPGQQLPSERDLAQELGVSRPTVREALIALEVAGLVEVKVGVGAFVRATGKNNPLPEADHSALEIMQARALVEPELAALAARHITAEGRAELAGIVAAMRGQTARREWSQDSDRALHLLIAEHCGNQALREIALTLWRGREEGLSAAFHQHLSRRPALLDRIMADHDGIAAAIAAADPDGARAAMAAHLDYVQREMLAVWD